MKMKSSNRFMKVMVLIAMFLSVSCSLDVVVKNPNSIPILNESGTPTPPDLASVYNQLNGLVTQSNWFAMEEHTSDEMMGPTRGTDWDDFGTWRKLHLHAWDASHNQINDTWNMLNGALFQTTLIAEATTGQQQTAGKFLRAYFSYLACDLFGVVQHRPATAAVGDIPMVFTRSEACDFIISELQAVIAATGSSALPKFDGTAGTRTVATLEAAEFLLAKTLLNKAVFKQDPKNAAGPFTFDPADMSQVITLCNAIASNGNLQLSKNYWDNFAWTNATSSTENIFVRPKALGITVQFPIFMGAHYHMVPSGWNGFVTLSDFYNAFDPMDARRNSWLPEYSDSVGYNAGFLVGQIYGPVGKTAGSAGAVAPNTQLAPLTDRSGNPLVFTPDASLFFSTETKGIRTNKYPIHPNTFNSSNGSASPNDFVFFRFADARLMKAEAILRGGSDTNGETALAIVNGIIANRGGAYIQSDPMKQSAGVSTGQALTKLQSIDLPGLLTERGKEMWCEGWRRNDMIRFGVFNQPVMERTTPSDPSRCVFPIPLIALSSNPNLTQNYGY